MSTILVIDDEPHSLQLLRLLLRKEGYQVEIGRDGFKALELVHRHAPDAVLLDVMMPGIDGYEVCQLIRNDPAVEMTPIVLLTTLSDRESRIKGLEAGADDFLTKPYDNRELRARLRTITRLNRARHIRDNAAKFESVVGNAPDPVAVLRTDGRIEMLNSAFSALCPKLREGQDFNQLLDPASLDAWRDWLAHHEDGPREAQSVFATTLQFDPPQAATDMEIKASRIPWLGTFAWLLHLRDVTERNRLQESLLQSQRMELLGTISAGLVHDLNNVLGAISGNAQVMQWVEKDRMDTFVENIVAGCGRGAGMLQQLLEFARGSAGEQEAVNLVEIAREVIKLTDHSFGSRYHLDLQGEASPPPVMGNTTQLHQIMMNLCVNARDAMPEGGQITMRFDVRPPPRNDDFNVGGPDKSWRDTEFVVLDVADSGTGIPEDVLPKLFDPLFTTKPIGQGTGLGLATVSKLMKDHGGFVLAGNQSAGGAVFSCYFPMAGVIA